MKRGANVITRSDRKAGRIRRHVRIRKRVFGTPERPRLAIFRSLNHIYAQVIDDRTGRTVVSASTLDADVKAAVGGNGGNMAAAKQVGITVARKAVEKGIKQVVFDRGGNIYHGRIAALAEAAREGGLEF